MAVVVIATTPGMTQEQYETAIGRLPGAPLPEGCTAHIAGPSDDGWRVVTVWDSAEVARAYMTEHLQPVMQELGVAHAGLPVIFPAHRVVTA